MNFRLAAVAALLSLLASCASMFDGQSSEVTFTSDPPGARVVAGEAEAVTPATLKVSKKLKQVTFHSPEHGEREVELERRMQAGFVLMDLLFTPGFGLSGLLIDGATSAWYKQPSIVHCDFTAPGEVPVVEPETVEATAQLAP